MSELRPAEFGDDEEEARVHEANSELEQGGRADGKQPPAMKAAPAVSAGGWMADSDDDGDGEGGGNDVEDEWAAAEAAWAAAEAEADAS